MRAVHCYDLGDFDDATGLPIYSPDHPHVPFNRISLSDNLEAAIRREVGELSEELQLARSSQDDSLPFVEQAWNALQQKLTTGDYALDRQAEAEKQRVLPRLLDRKTGHDNNNDSKSETAEPFYYYQASDGQYVFLHSLVHIALSQQFSTPNKFPLKLRGTIVDVERCEINEMTRNRFKFLRHLPLTCQICFCIIRFEDGKPKQAHFATLWLNTCRSVDCED